MKMVIVELWFSNSTITILLSQTIAFAIADVIFTIRLEFCHFDGIYCTFIPFVS